MKGESMSDIMPFEKAETRDKRLKLLLWGDSGSGKTTLALQFPRPAVIDLEGGTDLYGGLYNFEVLRASTADEVMQAIDWLRTHPHPYRTLVIDPITIYWDALQRKWSDIFLRRNKGSKHHKYEFYDLQPRDWMTVKAEFKDLLRKLIALDMNVVVTARQKVQYADGALMRAIGETFDGEKSLPYVFDTILRLHRDEGGRFLAECLKDRSRRMPAGSFEISYPRIEELLGRDSLTREAVQLPGASDSQVQTIKDHLAALAMSPYEIEQGLARYGVTRVEDLTEESAATILSNLTTALETRNQESVTQEVEDAEG